MGEVKITVKSDNSEQAKKELHTKIRKALEAAGIQASSAAREEIQKSPKRIDTYKADKASKYSGKIPEPGTYTGKAEKEPEGKEAVYVGTNVNYSVYV